jgi:hypothetical protein
MGGRLAILMEAIDGVDLSRLEGTPMPPKVALEIVERVADALDAAWNTPNPESGEPLRVVHRDIKPSNVMITPRGGVKVLDFGVARATFDSREAQTRGQQYGTARYMAPERWLLGLAEAPSDVFSLGITAIEVISGLPVERPRLDPGAFTEDLAAACARLAEAPAIQALIQRMTAFDANARPTAAEVADTCRRLISDAPEPGLRGWAADAVRRARLTRPHDPADGTVVSEDASAETFDAGVATAALPEAPAFPTAASASNRIDPEVAAPVPARTIAGMAGLVVGLALLLVAAIETTRPPPAPTPAPPPVVVAAPAPQIARPAPPAAAVTPPTTPPSPTRPAPAQPEPTPAPSTLAAREPPPSPPAEPAPQPAEDTLKFVIDPGLVVNDGTRRLTGPRSAYPYPRGALVELTVADGNHEYRCRANASGGTVAIHLDHCEQQ